MQSQGLLPRTRLRDGRMGRRPRGRDGAVPFLGERGRGCGRADGRGRRRCARGRSGRGRGGIRGRRRGGDRGTAAEVVAPATWPCRKPAGDLCRGRGPRTVVGNVRTCPRDGRGGPRRCTKPHTSLWSHISTLLDILVLPQITLPQTSLEFKALAPPATKYFRGDQNQVATRVRVPFRVSCVS